MASSRTQFAVVDQAIKSMKTVEEYINVGMETTVDVTLDFVDNDKDGNSGQVTDLKNVMLDYVRMERDLKQFLESVEFAKEQVRNEDGLSLEALLDRKLNEFKKGNKDADLKQHEKYTDLLQKIVEIKEPADSVTQQTAPDTHQDEDIAMTQQEVNTRCPYTGVDMKNPVRNKICSHNYDSDGIKQYMKQRGKRAKCPVGGCGNDKPIEPSHLEENKELKRYIERKNRQAGKKQKRT